MKNLFFVFAHILATIAKVLTPGGTKSLVSENLLLKQQLLIINRSRLRAPNRTPHDRLLFGFLATLLGPRRLRKSAIIIRPSTILGFHQALKKQKYRLLYSSKTRSEPGPKGPSAELIQLIVEMKRRNPKFGTPRISQEITRTFGIDIDKDLVRRVLAKHYRPEPGDGPSWLTFIGHMKDSLWSPYRRRQWPSALPYVQQGHVRNGQTPLYQLGPRPLVPLQPPEGQFTYSGYSRN